MSGTEDPERSIPSSSQSSSSSSTEEQSLKLQVEPHFTQFAQSPVSTGGRQQSGLQYDYEVIDDELMEKLGYDLCYNFARDELSIIKAGTIIAIVSNDDVLHPYSGKSIGQSLLKLKSELQIQGWAACRVRNSLIYQIRQIRTHADVNYPATNATSFKEQFEQHKRKLAKFESTEDEQSGKELIETLEGLVGQDAKSFDPLNYQTSPVERQVLFDKVAWKGSNRIWNVPVVQPLAEGEMYHLPRKAVESSGMVQQTILGTINAVARNQTEHLVEKLFDLYETSLVSIDDAQKVREQLLQPNINKPTQEEVMSQASRKRQQQKSKSARQYFHNSHPRQSTFTRSLGRGRARNRTRGRHMPFNFKNSYNTTQKEEEEEFPKSKGMRIVPQTMSITNPNRQNKQFAGCANAYSPQDLTDGAIAYTPQIITIDYPNKQNKQLTNGANAYSPQTLTGGAIAYSPQTIRLNKSITHNRTLAGGASAYSPQQNNSIFQENINDALAPLPHQLVNVAVDISPQNLQFKNQSITEQIKNSQKQFPTAIMTQQETIVTKYSQQNSGTDNKQSNFDIITLQTGELFPIQKQMHNNNLDITKQIP
ncbi:MAG: hypothetical protein EZS28_021479 [Streblomastix strix]|uniref:Uncharacterized protein n=1 Tax=Streblomastix strix TaxID=222440 RepID=A0A5J4VKF1_9EUKA|nr:MAG: hypothetical protein EZS28_021479 [Streblomastix strix]